VYLCKSAILTSMQLPKAYNPAEYESNIYALWEKGDVFKPKNRGGEGYFSMVLPPPNANANLHIGYGLTVAIYDILARYNRMLGKATLMVPGADHAGFETQAVYEKHLAKEGKSRFDFSREELYKQIWDFVELNKHNFQSQIRAFGASCDWTRFTYTLDNKVVAQAYDTFHKMWKEDLIYRGERIVNFCTFHGTSFADVEVTHKELKGKLWHIKYPVIEGGEITVATTRPETMLGDTAVAVNPKDKRYAELVGKTVKLPLLGREIPVVADEMVDIKFGTGAVKVTPAHDPNDFEVAQRHKLPMISVISTEGKITSEAPEKYRGLGIEEARHEVVEDLKKAGVLVDEQDYTHSVGHCYKCGTIIEPLLKEQWFVKMHPLAKKAIDALEGKKISFYPDSKRKQLIAYLNGLKDWNISRQSAWGIPIPAFQNTKDSKDWVFDSRIHEETIELNGKTYKRDPDVFDTWFSSGSWPYVTLDYPDGDDYKYFYPLTLMDTGDDILYPWVARMIMLGLYITDKIPFEHVYIHGYIRAEDGTKMSKSLGNTVEAMEVVNKYGSDASRVGLVVGRVPGVARPFDPRRLEEGRNFCNKLWNIARYVEARVGDDHRLKAEATPQTAADHWILERLNAASSEISKALEQYRLSEAYELLYHFIWDDFADWYIEASKIENNLGLLAYMLESTLKIAHPFAPFVTETIWQTLAWEEGTFLATQKWPEEVKFDVNDARKFEGATSIISEARQIISVLNINKPKLYYQYADTIVDQVGLILKLAKLGGVEETKDSKQQGLRLTNTKNAVWLEVDRKTAAAYMNKLEEERRERLQSIKRLEGRLSNKSYVDKAPAAIVEQTKAHLTEEQKMLATLEQELENFKDATRHI
jgi:valyl-tRNA synthetase